MTPPLLAIEGLEKSLSERAVLAGVSFALERGELAGLVGPNGSGKTTLVRCISGILAVPPPGCVRVCGHDVRTSPIEARRRLGCALDPHALPQGLTGLQFLELCASARNLDDVGDDVRGLARRLDIDHRLGDEIDRYSLGMRQKLALLAAFLGDPELLLLDEAMANLDPVSAYHLKQFLLDRTQAGRIGVLLCSHHLDFVEKLCTRVLVLHEGRILRNWSREALRAETAASGADLEALFVRITAPVDAS